jgi:hypothetical protein
MELSPPYVFQKKVMISSMFGSQPRFAKPNFSKYGSHKNVARILQATKCGKHLQKMYSMIGVAYE